MYYPIRSKPTQFLDIRTVAIYVELLKRTVEHVPNFLENLESCNPATEKGIARNGVPLPL